MAEVRDDQDALGDHFTVSFEGPSEADLAARVLESLDRASWRIGEIMGTYPTDPIEVLLYTNEQFRNITRAPQWAGGAYDRVIRVPMRGQGILYLVGSVHLLSEDYYPLSPALDAAFKESDLLVQEVDLGEMASVESRKAGFDPALGPDKHFYDLARAEGKQVQGLEMIDFQISRFDQMTMAEQDRLLVSTLKELDTQKASVTILADAWKARDEATVERIVLLDLRQEPGMYQQLLVERNRNWIPKIDALFTRPGRAFVLVGAAHLVGPDGLLSMLRPRATLSSSCDFREAVS